MSSPSRHPRNEEGSALLLALFFATIFSLFVASVISFTEVGLRASASFAAKAKSAYAADGAINAAINNYADSGCDDYPAPSSATGPVNGQGMIVHCAAGARASSPVNALLSLGTVPNERGIDSTADLRVLGNIVSNSTVRSGGTMVVQGEVSALGACTPLANIQTEPAVQLHCSNVTTPAPSPADPGQGRDPDYTKATTVVPLHRTVGPCPATGTKIVSLEPGYYDDDALVALNALTNGACSDSVIWFKPGVYYLDFTFLRGAPAADAGKWTVTDASVLVLGGTPLGWSPTGPLPATVPGTCQPTGPGVQVIMGGQDTRLEVTAGQVEFCAEPSTTDQQIAIFGLRADLAEHVLAPTAVSGPTGFTDTTSAMTIGEQPPPPLAAGPLSAVASLDQTTPSASLTLTGFKPSIPVGSVIDSAVLRVAHQDDTGVDVSVSATGESAPCTPPHTLTSSTTFTPPDTTIDLKACGLTTPAAFNTLAVTYTASTAGTTAVSDRLDGIAVDVRYRPPVTRRPTTVTASTAFTDTGRALEIGEQSATGAPLTATATLSGTTPSAVLTVAGFGDPPIPAGSTIDAAVLRVAHRDQGDIVATGPTVSAGTCAGATAVALPLYSASIGEDRVDLKALCGVTSAASLVGLTATYQVALTTFGAAATDDLDGMWLELVYTPPIVTREATTATSTGVAPLFAAPADAIALDGTTSDTTLSTVTQVAKIVMTGYSPPAGVGPGLDTAVVRARHQTGGNAGPVTLTATWTGGATGIGGSCSTTFAPRPGAVTDDRLDLKACGLADPTLAGLTVTYTAVLGGAGGTSTDKVDGIVLDLAFAPAAAYRPGTATSDAVTGFANPDSATTVGETPTPLTADAAPGASPASVSFAGFDQVKIPTGSAIDSAVLRVVHQDDGLVGPVGIAVTGANVPCGNDALALHAATPGTDTVDVRACGFDTVGSLSALTATYRADALSDTTRPATTETPPGFSPGFSPGTNAGTIDGVSDTVVLDTTGTAPATASVTLGGYDVSIPAGVSSTAVDAAVLRIVHRDENPIDPVSVDVSWTGGGGGSCTRQLPSRRTTLGLDVISLKGCGLADLGDLTGLSVTYTATLSASNATASDSLDGIELAFASDRLDGVALDVVFRPPSFRPLSGCVTTESASPGAASGCALVRVAPAALDIATRLVSRGTIYAPSAALDISMAGLKAQVLTRGLIARSMVLGLKADPSFKRPTGGVPPEAVVFTAYPEANVKGDIEAGAIAGFGAPLNAKSIDGTTADAVTTTTGGPPFTPSTMLFTGFDAAAVPAGTVIDAAVLQVAHHDDGDILSVSVTVNFSGHTCTVDIPLHTTMATDQVDLSACGLTNVSQLAGLDVTYTATVDPDVNPATTPTVTDSLDGIVLVVRWGPIVRATVTFDRGKATIQGWSVLR